MTNIDLASFSFDYSEIVKGAAEIKKEIERLKKQQKDLAKEMEKGGQGASEQFVRNAADLKTLNAVYNEHVKYLADASKQALDNEIREKALDLVLNQEALTIKELREQNKQLNALRNTANLTTEEGKKELKLLNAQLDKNNKLIKDNVDAYTKHKINIGNYTQSIREALDGMNPFNVSIAVFIQNAQKAGGVSNFLSNSLKTVTSGVAGLTKASLAFIATPLGAVITALVTAFLLIKNAINQGTESTEKLSKVLSVFGKLLKPVYDLVLKLGDYLIQGLVVALEAVASTIDKMMGALSKVLNFLGFDAAAKSTENWRNQIYNATKETSLFIREQQKLNAMIKNNIKNENDYRKAIMDLNKVREDDNRSISERIEAIQKLREVQMKQLNEQLAAAKQALKIAQLAVAVEKHLGIEIPGVQKKYRETYAAMLDIEERINSFMTQSINDEKSLRQKAFDDLMKKKELEIEIYKTSQSEKAKTMQQELELAEEVYRRTLEIEKKKLANKKISEEEFALFVIEQEQQLARMRAEIAVDAAARELAEYKRSFDAQMAERKFLSEEVLANKIAEHNALLEQQVAYEAMRLEQGLISQQEYDDAVFALTEANRIAVAELNKEREQVEKEEALELKALEFEEELARMLEQGATRFEIEQEQLRQQAEERKAALDAQLAEGLISQELYDAKLLQLKRQTAEAEKKIEEALFKEKLALSTQLLDAAAGAVNKESKAGKAIALAKAAINMYQGISAGVALGFPMSIPAVAAAAITGGKAISDIVSTKVPSAKGGGDVGGGSGSQVSPPKMMNLSGSGVNLGSLNGNIQNQMKSGMDSEMMKNEMREAIRDGAREGTAEGSQEGIIELTGNQEIARQSSF
jgi:uncharacterized protein with PIN domain